MMAIGMVFSGASQPCSIQGDRNGLLWAPLSQVMRRLLTGYAVSFNQRHRRSGHLFQNRYK